MRLSEYLNFRQSLRTRQDVEKAAQESQHSFETLFSIVSQTTSRHVRSHFKARIKNPEQVVAFTFSDAKHEDNEVPSLFVPRLLISRSPRFNFKTNSDEILQHGGWSFLIVTQQELVKKTPVFLHQYLRMNQSIVTIAKRAGFPPCDLARRICGDLLGLSSKSITKLLRNPQLIEDPRLRSEIMRCLAEDEFSGPDQDLIRNEIGIKYEKILEGQLEELGIEFETETQLRERGEYKTPDVLLAVPMGVNNHVVRWIDSKAKFGDPSSMDKDYESQVASYSSRFGPGLVIYWFDYVEDLIPNKMMNDRDVLVLRELPTDVHLLAGTSKKWVSD